MHLTELLTVLMMHGPDIPYARLTGSDHFAFGKSTFSLRLITCTYIIKLLALYYLDTKPHHAPRRLVIDNILHHIMTDLQNIMSLSTKEEFFAHCPPSRI